MPDNIIVGVEIGTSKICAMVAEVTQPGVLNIIGVGQARSSGVRKGEIIDPQRAIADLRIALSEAEQTADVTIEKVFLGVTGSHIQGFISHGFHPIASADREITQQDVNEVLRNAKSVNLPASNAIIHAIRQYFTVDGQDGIINPVGMLGARLEVDVHIVHGNFNRLQNPIRLVKECQIEVEQIAFNGLASALAVLDNEKKELGSLVIDLGGGTTDYVVVSDGIVKHCGVLAVGGDHISNDIALGLKISLGRAEQLKIQYGSAVMPEDISGKYLTINNEVGIPAKTISCENLLKIMTGRIDEIFELVHRDLDEKGLLASLRGGVFICGGGARIPGILTVAERYFGIPAYIGHAVGIGGVKSALDQPEFATAIGLVKFGSMYQKQVNERDPFAKVKKFWSSVVSMVRGVI